METNKPGCLMTLFVVILSCILLFNAESVSAKIITLCKGETYQLKVDKNSKVKISNSKIVKHLKTGKIRALKSGKCTVKVIKGKKVKKYSFVIDKKKHNKNKNKNNNKNINTDKNPDTPVNNVPDVTHIVRSGAFSDVYFYNAESVDEMIQFMNSPNSKTVNNGAFQNVVELYKGVGYMHVPAVLGLHTAISKVEICSNRSYMTFYFENGRQVSINPLSEEELELCNSLDSIQFLVNKKGIQMNEDQDVYLEYDGVKQDTVTGTMRWTEDSILVDGKETRCLMCMENSKSGIISCVKAFIYNGLIVHVNNYSQQAIDTEFMKSVSFTKIQLNN